MNSHLVLMRLGGCSKASQPTPDHVHAESFPRGANLTEPLGYSPRPYGHDVRRTLLRRSLQYGATNDVIAHELDAVATSENPATIQFLRRTGIPPSSEGRLNRLTRGSAADQITDGLNELHLGRTSGLADELCLMARCT